MRAYVVRATLDGDAVRLANGGQFLVPYEGVTAADTTDTKEAN